MTNLGSGMEDKRNQRCLEHLLHLHYIFGLASDNGCCDGPQLCVTQIAIQNHFCGSQMFLRQCALR